MDRPTCHDDGIDFRAKTEAMLRTCIARRQWHNVATLGGFRSEHDARVRHDPSYADTFSIPKPVSVREPAEPLSVKKAMKLQSPPPPRVRDDAAWVADVRARMDAANLTAQQLSVYIGCDKMYVTNFLAPKGQRWPAGKLRIENGLTHLEAESASRQSAQGEAA